MPDERAFVVIWMLRRAIAPAFQLEGAFNDVAIRLEPGASLPGGARRRRSRARARTAASTRSRASEQMSNYALTGELDKLRNARAHHPGDLPRGRRVPRQRRRVAARVPRADADRGAQGARLHATARIALHYLGLVALIVAIGAVLGIAARCVDGTLDDRAVRRTSIGSRRGSTACRPACRARPLGDRARRRGDRCARRGPPGHAHAAGRGDASAGAARLSAHARRAARDLDRFLGPSAMMVVREIERRPLRFLMSTAGIAMGVGDLHLRPVLVGLVRSPDDRRVRARAPRGPDGDARRAQPARAVQELAALPGVAVAEGQRVVPVRIRSGSRWRDIAIVGLPETPALQHAARRRDAARAARGWRRADRPARGAYWTSASGTPSRSRCSKVTGRS